MLARVPEHSVGGGDDPVSVTLEPRNLRLRECDGRDPHHLSRRLSEFERFIEKRVGLRLAAARAYERAHAECDDAREDEVNRFWKTSVQSASASSQRPRSSLIFAPNACR